LVLGIQSAAGFLSGFLKSPPGPAADEFAPPSATPRVVPAGGPDAFPADLHSSNFRFPAGFLWGAATSAHQVEGNCNLNGWWDWEQAGRVPHRSGPACDHYHRFKEDFDLARSLRHNAHRFSSEWSRIEPLEGNFSEEAL